MADIQPKNTDTIRVNTIKEKTAAAGVSIFDELICADTVKPSTALVNLGTSTAGLHFLQAFLKTLTSNGQALTIQTTSTNDIVIKLNSLTIWTFSQSSGNFTGDSTNGGDIVFGKSGSAVVHNGDATFTALGTTQGTAAAITKTVTVVTTCSAGVTDGVQLPAPTSTTLFKPKWIANESGATCKVYGTTGVNIDDGAANAAFSLTDNTHKMFLPITTTRWLSF